MSSHGCHAGVNMRGRIITVVVLAWALLGCNEAGPPIDRVQLNLVDKAIFQGEWWYGQTVVGVDGDEAGTVGNWEGMQAWADLGLDTGQSGTMPRIRWVIDEGFLYAYRAYELIAGGNDDGRAPDFRGQPLAAFRIQGHFDVRYDYNPVTGERTNVRVENASDRRWYERRFMRVDWSQNVMTSFYYLSDIDLGSGFRREPAALFFDEGSVAPADYLPKFVRVGEDPEYRFAAEWPANARNTVHYMAFVTQELHSPGAQCFYYAIPCQTVAVQIRNAFLRVPPNHEYAVETQSHAEFDRFGTFRTYQRTYVRGGAPRDTVAERCETDADCGSGGRCDPTRRICVGGLTRDLGELDFLAFYRPRHNFYADSLTDQECIADWQCDGRYEGIPEKAGSVCDRAARRCTIPMRDRPTRRVVYHLNKGYPVHLVRAAFEVVADWNEVFMRGQRALTGRPLPSGGRTRCQSVDPTRYCYCGTDPDGTPRRAAEVGEDGTCAYRYDPFQRPDLAAAAGVSNPYQCWVSGPPDPDHPASYADYGREHYGYKFEGEECLFILKANSCDVTPGAPCEELGDIRYQFFNYIAHNGLFFGGVAAPQVDPETGELITASVNLGGTSVESVANYALVMFPVLRGEPGALDDWWTGERLRRYMEGLGRVEHPVGIATSGTDGHTTTTRDRPGIPADLTAHIRSVLDASADRLMELRGAEGRARIFSDRRSRLAGTDIEHRLVQALGPNGWDAMHVHADAARLAPGARVTDPDVLDRVSPFRRAFLDTLTHEEQRRARLARFNIDPPFAPEVRSANWQWWAEAFAGRPAGEASIRMQQWITRAIMWHEIGHSVGLRHNFAGSLDRDNYYDGYFHAVLGREDDPSDDLALPRLQDYDRDASGYVTGAEINEFYADLRRVRDERARRNVTSYMSSSIMDYHGDMSDTFGIGRYDAAAAIWNHFGLVEAYVGDPRHRSDDSLDRLELAHIVPRRLMQTYEGGESCDVDTDCPHGPGRETVAGQPIHQRCIRNPRVSRLPTPCEGDRHCICSAFDEDFLDYVDGVAYDHDADRDGELDYYPVTYLFCTDDRTNDISWCNRFDAGETFQEVIDNFRRRFEETYPLSYYRRYRNTSLRGGASIGSIIDAAKIYQHLFFRYFYEPAFRAEEGPLGLADQYQASVDAMNWFIELAEMPEVGSYRLDRDRNVYERISDVPGARGADLSLDLGQGFPLWSQYQEGFYGFFRRERAGVFYDKYIAMLALAIRDWGLSFTIDERFYINFYDLFPIEMTEFFGGRVLDEPRWHAPRVVEAGTRPRIRYLSYFRDLCNRGGRFVPCRDSNDEVYPEPAIDSTSNDIFRQWAAILALAEFPVFYDTSFEQRLSVFKLGNGDGFDLADVQPDGSRTCAYGDVVIEPSHARGCDDRTPATEADYVVYESERFHTSYIAVKVRARLFYNLPEEQVGYELLKRMVNMQERIRTLRARPMLRPEEAAELRELQERLTRDESFLELLIDIQRRYGISSWF